MKRRQSVALYGRDHHIYGLHHLEPVEPFAAAAISVGADRASPSLRAKGDLRQPNEDALCVIVEAPMLLAAVADSHFGLRASHALIAALHALPELPRSASELEAALTRLEGRLSPEDGDRSASTLLVTVYDRETREGHFASWGDSTLAAVGGGGFRMINRQNPVYISPASYGSALRRADRGSYSLGNSERLLLFTDGINECHYREPATSVRGEHIAKLAAAHPRDPAGFARALVELALAGVDGHPGGQDNIALVVLQTSTTKV